MAFNMRGVPFDQRVAGGQRNYEFNPKWSNSTRIHRGYWISEVALPYEAFGLAAPQKTWRINFCRRIRNDMLAGSSWSWRLGSWHTPNRFGYLKFGK